MDSIQRRDFLEWLGGMLGAPLLPPIAAGILSGCRVVPTSAEPSAGDSEPRGAILDGPALALVEVLCEQIIPTTDTPGAAAAGVHLYIDQMLADFFGEDERARFLAGLEALDATATEAHGRSYAGCTPAEQHALLTAASEAPPPASGEASLFTTLKQLTVAGYYTSQIGMTQELRLNPMGRWDADLPYADIGRAWA